jgi:orotidine-5'-phosphate decarboxylase
LILGTLNRNNLSQDARERLIFALDYPSLKEAREAVSILRDHVGIFKVGLELFVSAGPAVLEFLAEKKAGIFLDLKFHDIPATVEAAVKAAAGFKARFVTVHAAEGIGLLKTVVRNVPRATKVLAVTVLTSLNQQDMKDVGMKEDLNLTDLAVLRARLARDAGCAGVVCSGAEVRKIKQAIGESSIAVVPGIRLDGAPVSNDDQKRAATPREAVLNGADFIVVGRPIRRAKDPAAAADRIVREVESALREKSIGG